VLALLGCGLICLLVINTTLAAGSFQISNLQRDNTAAAQRVQELQQQVSTDESASSIEQRALRLGMRPQPTLNFVNLQTGRRYTMPARVPGVYAVPGYTP
jgi:pyrroline-5-carboxylate reductase